MCYVMFVDHPFNPHLTYGLTYLWKLIEPWHRCLLELPADLKFKSPIMIVFELIFVIRTEVNKGKWKIERDPWFSGYGRRLRVWWSWVQIPVPYTRWSFIILINCKIYNVCLKKIENKLDIARVGPNFRIGEMVMA